MIIKMKTAVLQTRWKWSV